MGAPQSYAPRSGRSGRRGKRSRARGASGRRNVVDEALDRTIGLMEDVQGHVHQIEVLRFQGLQRNLEQLALKVQVQSDFGVQADKTCMQLLPGMFASNIAWPAAAEVNGVAGDEREVFVHHVLDERVVLRAGPAAVAHTRGFIVTVRDGNADKFRRETFVNQEFECHAFAGRTTRVTFGTAEGLLSLSLRGRPRRGWTCAYTLAASIWASVRNG